VGILQRRQAEFPTEILAERGVHIIESATLSLGTVVWMSRLELLTD
jgi:hypothetical protein